MAEVIYTNLFLEALFSCFTGLESHNSSVVEQNIKLLVLSTEVFRKGFDRIKIIKIQLHKFAAFHVVIFVDLVHGIGASFDVTTRHNNCVST